LDVMEGVSRSVRRRRYGAQDKEELIKDYPSCIWNLPWRDSL